MSREEAINSLVAKLYTKDEVANLINSISTAHKLHKPTKVKKGDVFLAPAGGFKVRPTVVIKVLEDKVIGIPLTTTEDHHALTKSSSRFLKDGFFTSTLTTETHEMVKKTFITTYDNPKLLNKAIKAVREFYSVL